ncbi:MAG: hypothetical protein WBN04_17835 [Paracoccaceae bacterium]
MTHTPPRLPQSLLRIAIRLALILAIAYAAHWLMGWVQTRMSALPAGGASFMLTSLLIFVLLAYAILIAIPYVPGVEIGISLLVMEGASVAPLVYLGSVAGLMLAYLAGYLLPYPWLTRTLRDLRLRRAADLLDAAQMVPPQERLAVLSDRLPKWLGPHLVRWRYLVLALLINLPGSSLIGGGGGICLIAGLSRLFAPVPTIVTFFLAVLPVPLGIWFFGIGFLP